MLYSLPPYLTVHDLLLLCLPSLLSVAAYQIRSTSVVIANGARCRRRGVVLALSIRGRVLVGWSPRSRFILSGLSPLPPQAGCNDNYSCACDVTLSRCLGCSFA